MDASTTLDSSGPTITQQPIDNLADSSSTRNSNRQAMSGSSTFLKWSSTNSRHSSGVSNTPKTTTNNHNQRAFRCLPKRRNPIGQAVWCGRIVFVLCLTGLAVGLGYLSYRQQDTADRELAESLFRSMTDRALLKAVNTLHQKQWTIASLATVLSHLEPNAEPYPYVAFPSLQAIANDMRSISTMETLGFVPFVLPEHKQRFEQFAYEYFDERNFTLAGRSPFGRGVFQIVNGTRYPDDGWNTWGSPYHLLTPALEVEAGDHPLLLFNLHSDPKRGRPIDVLMDCVTQSQESGSPPQRCTTISELIVSHKESNNGPASANWAPVFPANNPDRLVGLTGSLIVWEEILENAFASKVSGVDCVLESIGNGITEPQAFTYTIVEGVAVSKGQGDLHDVRFDGLGRSAVLTDDYEDENLFAPQSIGYRLSFYPNQDLYATYNSGNHTAHALLTAGIVGIVSLLFFLYDFFVRREFMAKKELLESKRKFMRFVSHEVRTPLNAVCMGLCVVRHEIAASLGYRTAEDLQLEIDTNPNITTPPSATSDSNSNNNNNNRALDNNTQIRQADNHTRQEESPQARLKQEDDEMKKEKLALSNAIEASLLWNNNNNTTITTNNPTDSNPLDCPTREMAIEWFNTANDVLANTQSAVDVLSDLLNYDKVQSNTLTLELTKVPIWSLIESTMDEFRLPAMNKKVDFDISFVQGDYSHASAHGLPACIKNQHVVVGDEIRLQQVLRNLASNAVKFTGEGGRVSIQSTFVDLPRVHMSGRRKKVPTTAFELKDGTKVSLQRSGTLTVEVEDSGVGMSSEQLQKVCSPGVQFNVNELQGGKGSGLGLFIAKGIVEQHKGVLEASSPGLGKGTKFSLTIPLYLVDHIAASHNNQSTATALPQPISTQPPPSNVDQEEPVYPHPVEEDLETGVANKSTQSSKTGDTVDTSTSLMSSSTRDGMSNSARVPQQQQKEQLRVLVVDDIPANRKLLGRLLQINGHSYDMAVDGREAVEQVCKAIDDNAMYDSVLLDFEMPVMNGPDAAVEIRGLCPEVNIVGITGNMLSDDIALFKASGANEVMGKPFKMQTLEGIWKQHGVLADQ